MHSHKHAPAPRWLNCAPMHLQWQNSARNGSHLYQCLLTHSECTQPTLASMLPYTLKMHSSNSCINASLHTQNALNQLKSSALWMECAQIHLSNSIKTYNAGLHIQLRNTSKEHQSRSCAPPNSKWPPNPQSSSKALQNSSKAPKAPPAVQTCSSNTHKPSRFLSQCTQAIKPLMMQFAWVGP